MSFLFFLNSADDMGLGKTLTMISLILTKKNNEKEEADKKEVKKLEKWISKAGNFNRFFLFRMTEYSNVHAIHTCIHFDFVCH